MKLPDLEETEIIVDSPNNSNNKLLSQILNNVESIKNIEKENAELKKRLLENRDKINERKVEELIKVLNYKEKKYKEFHNNILEHYEKVKKNTNKTIKLEKHRYETLEKKYKELLIYANKIKQEKDYLKTTSIKTKFLMKKNFEKKIKKILGEYELHKKTHKDIIREHEDFKINMKNQHMLQIKKSEFLAKKNSELIEMNKELEKEKLRFMETNKKLLFKLNEINKSSIGNKKVLNNKIESMRKELEEKLKDLTKQHLDKEIEYRATIDSLKKDLSKYYSELRNLREKYNRREKELRGKIKQFTQLL